VAAPALDDAYHRVVEFLAQEPPPMSESYEIVPPPGSPAPLDPKQIADLLAKDGQLILPLLDLLENAQCALDDLIDVMGRATTEAVLRMSAEAIAGPKQEGKKFDRDIVYHDTTKGRVALKEREIVVDKPRLRRRHPQQGESAEVEIPAYETMRGNSRLAQRMLEIRISGVSTRRHEPILPAMAGTVGVSKSQVSRQTIEGGERLLEDLTRRDFSTLDLLAVWIDGIQLGPYHVICAAGVDDQGHKHVLGLQEGATENAELAKALLEDLAGRGVDTKRRRLFRIDGALALREAVDLVFGVGAPVQRCRNHKLRNMLGHLPEAQHDQARSTLKAAFKLDAREGTAELQKYATWLEREWPSATGSLREGLDEIFTINRLGLPSELRRCLETTNLIDNGHSALRDRVRRVKHWQSGSMALPWAAVAFDAVSKRFRRIMGYKHLWMLKAALDEPSRDRSLVDQARAG
jgi:transposase-like protein